MTFNENPDPSVTPPHAPEYQYQFAPEPKVPPDIPNVTVEPEQIFVELPVIEFACVEFVFTITLVLTQTVVLHNPSALTKYDVFKAGVS